MSAPGPVLQRGNADDDVQFVAETSVFTTPKGKKIPVPMGSEADFARRTLLRIFNMQIEHVEPDTRLHKQMEDVLPNIRDADHEKLVDRYRHPWKAFLRRVKAQLEKETQRAQTYSESLWSENVKAAFERDYVEPARESLEQIDRHIAYADKLVNWLEQNG